MNFKLVSDRVKMSSYYKTMNLLLINDIYELEIAKFMHSFYHGMHPVNFLNFFKSSKTQHSYNTRTTASDGYYLERAYTKRRQLSCTYEGVKIWNKLPLDAKKLSKRIFCKRIKKSLIERC